MPICTENMEQNFHQARRARPFLFAKVVRLASAPVKSADMHEAYLKAPIGDSRQYNIPFDGGTECNSVKVGKSQKGWLKSPLDYLPQR